MTLRQQMEAIISKNPFISKKDIVYTLVLDGILNGDFKGGQKVNQEDLSAQLQISRTPVREAFTCLNEEGYLVKEGASGHYIYQLQMEDYLTINEFRTMLESFSVELAVRHSTSRELDALARNIRETERAVEENDLRAFSGLDYEFHKLLVQAAQNPMILKTYEEHEQKFQLFRFLTLSEGVMATALRWHRKIVQAVEDGDVEAATKATRMHRDNTVSATLALCRKRAE